MIYLHRYFSSRAPLHMIVMATWFVNNCEIELIQIVNNFEIELMQIVNNCEKAVSP